MENEKFQDLMLEHFGKVLTKLDGMESRLTGVETELTGVKSEVTTIKSELVEVKESQIRMENEVSKKLDVLYKDWRGTQQQFNEEIKQKNP